MQGYKKVYQTIITTSTANNGIEVTIMYKAFYEAY